MKGSCHCGAVRFEVAGPVRRSSVCHCGQCRRMSGGEWASADLARADVRMEGETPLLCTEKDAVKLWRQEPRAWAVPLELEMDAAFWPALGARLGRKLSSADGPQAA